MRIDVATDYISNGLRDLLDEAYLAFVEQGLPEDEAYRLCDLLDNAEFTVDYGEDDVRPL